MQNNPAYHLLIDNKDKHLLEYEIENIASLRKQLIEFGYVNNENIEIQFYKDGQYIKFKQALEQIVSFENFECSEEHPILVNHIDEIEAQKQKQVEEQEVIKEQNKNIQEEQFKHVALLIEELEQSKEQNQFLEQQIIGLKQQIEKIKVEKQTLVNQQADEAKKSQIKKQEQQQLESLLQDSKKKVDEILQQIEQQQQVILQQQIKISELEHSSDQLQKYKQQVEQLQQDIVQQQIHISKYEHSSEQLQQLLKSSNSVREMIRDKTKEFEQDKKLMELTIQSLKQKLDATTKEKMELINTVLKIEEIHGQLLFNQKIDVGNLINLIQQDNNLQQQNNQVQQSEQIKIQSQQDIKQKSEVKSEIIQKETDSKISEINQLKKALDQAVDNELNYQIPNDYKSEKVYINFLCRKPGHEGNPIGQICLQDRCKQGFGCMYCTALHVQNHSIMPLDQFFNHIDQLKQTLNIEDYWEKLKFQYKQYKESSFLMILKIKEQNQNISKQINSVFKYLQTFNESDPQRLEQYKRMVLDNGKEIQQVMDQSLQTIIASTEIIRKLNLVNCHFCHQQCDQNNEDEQEVFLSECGHSLHRQCYVQLVEKQIMNTQAKCLCHSKLSLAILSNKNNNKEAKFKVAILDNQLDQIRGDLQNQVRNCPDCRFFCINNGKSYCPTCDKNY